MSDSFEQNPASYLAEAFEFTMIFLLDKIRVVQILCFYKIHMKCVGPDRAHS